MRVGIQPAADENNQKTLWLAPAVSPKLTPADFNKNAKPKNLETIISKQKQITTTLRKSKIKLNTAKPSFSKPA